MPCRSRIDAPGSLHYIIVDGFAKRSAVKQYKKYLFAVLIMRGPAGQAG